MAAVGGAVGTAAGAAGLSSVATVAGTSAGAAAVGTITTMGAVGVGTAAAGAEKMARASDIEDSAVRTEKRAAEKLKHTQTVTNNALENLGREKVEDWIRLKHYVELCNKITDMPLKSEMKLDGRFVFDEMEMKHIEEAATSILEVLGQGAVTATSGQLIGLAASSGITSMATASTGTAIAGLHGAAAANASLAALGGGSLASGGLGMAGGAVVANVLTFAPVMAISGTGTTYYEYRVVESDAENGNYIANGTLKLGEYKYIVASTEQTIKNTDKSASLTLTNTRVPPVYELAITKQGLDENGTTTRPLNGVEFKLEKLNGNEVDATFNNNVGFMSGTTESVGGDAGKCSFKNLSEGSYRLTELKTVDGYNLLAAPIEFTLQNGQCLINRMPQDGMVTGNPADGYTVSLIINNRKGFTLPHTGADAPSLWLLIGLPLLVAGLLVLVFRYNRKGGKRS